MLNHCKLHVADGIAHCGCIMFTLLADVIAMCLSGRCETTNWCIILADVIAKWQME